jgi:hypothetical protein
MPADASPRHDRRQGRGEQHFLRDGVIERASIGNHLLVEPEASDVRRVLAWGDVALRWP